MNTQEQIQTIESKIVELKNTLQTWTNQLNHYYTTLSHLTNQLTEIKKQLK